MRVAAVNDYELIVAGVARLLSQFPEQLDVCDRIVIGDPIDTPIDVALYDTYGRVGIAAPALQLLADTPEISYIAMFTLDLSPELIAEGRAAGATGFISKSLSGAEIADAIVRVAQGEQVVAAAESAETGERCARLARKGGRPHRTREPGRGTRGGGPLQPSRSRPLLYLSPETVKGYLRQAFAKLGLRNRVEATNYVRRSGAFVRYQSAEPEHDDSTFEPPVSG